PARLRDAAPPFCGAPARTRGAERRRSIRSGPRAVGDAAIPFLEPCAQARRHESAQPAAMTERTTAAIADPDRILKGISALVTLTGMYPSGHPLVADRLREVHDGLRHHLKDNASVHLDVIRGVLHVNGVASETRTEGYGVGIDSLHVDAGVRIEEL